MDDAVVSLALCNYFKPLAEAVEIYIVLYGFELEDSDLLRWYLDGWDLHVKK